MAEEKILKEEQLTEEELENVAGGSTGEILDDIKQLRKYGFNLPNNASRDQVNDAMWQLGQRLGFSLGTDLHDGTEKNRYYINHDKKSHDEVWEYVRKHSR